MKELLAGIILVIVLGLGAFFYRNVVERPKTIVPQGSGTTNGMACTDEAKVCPDGTAVGRTGPNCSFAPCLPPNAELTFGSTTIAFVLPAGYVKSSDASDATLVASYAQSSVSPSEASTITIHEYPLGAGQTASGVMIQNTTFDPSGLPATSTNAFHQITEGTNTFYSVQIGRFEGVVQTAYYLVQASDVLRFDIIERNVQNWTDPSLVIATLPQHQALLQILATLQGS